MPHNVAFHPQEGLIIARLIGPANLPTLLEFLDEVIKTAREANCYRILTDMRAAELKLSLVDIYALPGLVLKAAVRIDLNAYAAKRALVTSANQEEWQFYETVSRNRSHNVRLFHDIEEAKKWLLE